MSVLIQSLAVAFIFSVFLTLPESVRRGAYPPPFPSQRKGKEGGLGATGQLLIDEVCDPVELMFAKGYSVQDLICSPCFFIAPCAEVMPDHSCKWAKHRIFLKPELMP